MGLTWCDSSTRALIEIWNDQNIQEQLEGSTRNIIVYRRMADRLNRVLGLKEGDGDFRTAQQCRAKVKNLKTEYKKVVDSKKVSFTRNYPRM